MTIRDLLWATAEAVALFGFLAVGALWLLLVTGGLPV